MASCWCHSSLLLRVDSFFETTLSPPRRPCPLFILAPLPHVPPFRVLVGETLGLDNCLRACDIRDMPSSDETIDWIRTYGTIDGGVETMCQTWPALDHRFAVRRPPLAERNFLSAVPTTYDGPRFPLDLLTTTPVDLLAVEQGHLHLAPPTAAAFAWESAVSKTPSDVRPRLVVEMWPGGAGAWSHGPTCKSVRTRWAELGYVSRFKRVNAVNVGGAIAQVRFVAARVRLPYASGFAWAAQDLSSQRAMSNLLTPSGLVRCRYLPSSADVGRVYDPGDPMPSLPGRWISTDRGVRRLLPVEVARGLGASSRWTKDDAPLPDSLLRRSSSIFHWEYISSSILRTRSSPPELISPDDFAHRVAAFVDSTSSPPPPSDLPPFVWSPPDLSFGGTFHAARIASLRAAANTYANSAEIFDAGLKDLRVHSGNYNADGPAPSRLQLLWWKFPPEK